MKEIERHLALNALTGSFRGHIEWYCSSELKGYIDLADVSLRGNYVVVEYRLSRR